jgi:hypothetical protein
VGDATAQADYYLKNIAGHIGKGIMVLDYEADALKQGYSWAHTFCKRIIDKTGIPPLIYASTSPMKSYGLTGLAQELDVGLWVAAYPNSSPQGYSRPDPPIAEAAMYQYASTGRLSGYGGNLDLNVFYGDAKAWASYAKGGTPHPSPILPQPTPPSNPSEGIDVFYRVKTAEDGWLAEVKNLEDYAGLPEHAIIGLAARVSEGSLWYQAHVVGGGWLDKVSGYDTNDYQNGFAGTDVPIDLIRCYLNSPKGDKIVKYRVAAIGQDYYDWQRDDETTRGQDGFAGAAGVKIDRLQMVVEG